MATILISSPSSGPVGGLAGGGQGGSCSGVELVSQVTRIVGGEDENSVRAHALALLNGVRDELNMHDWRFLKKSVASTAFTAATSTYSLGGTFKSPGYFRVLDSNGKPYCDLRYIDDATMNHAIPQQTLSGVPAFYSLRNTFGDGLITFYPTPDASTATGYTWAGEFYTRLGNITDDGTVIAAIPDEICRVLILGAQAYLLRELDRGSSQTTTAWQDFERIKHLALVNDRRMSDNYDRFRLSGIGRRRFYNSNDYYGWFW